MPLHIVRNDITKMQVDAIVNAANETLLGGGGVDGSIHEAAGPELLKECAVLGGCKPGQAKITGGYKLPSSYVIHTVGPVWRGGEDGEQSVLSACYKNSLELALQHKCESIAFPVISSGSYGYPKAQAISTAVSAISEFLSQNDMTVYLVVFDRKALTISEKLFADIKEYIDDNYVHQMHLEHSRSRNIFRDSYSRSFRSMEADELCLPMASMAVEEYSIEDIVFELDESFSQMLLRKIDEAGMTDAQCYKRANIDRRLFSKIRADKNYKPSKSTALAFAVALKLSLSETEELLRKAGFALSHSNVFDIVVEYFIKKGNYNIFEINEALFAFDQSLLEG